VVALVIKYDIFMMGQSLIGSPAELAVRLKVDPAGCT
jgi:hypothetical protein